MWRGFLSHWINWLLLRAEVAAIDVNSRLALFFCMLIRRLDAAQGWLFLICCIISDSILLRIVIMSTRLLGHKRRWIGMWPTTRNFGVCPYNFLKRGAHKPGVSKKRPIASPISAPLDVNILQPTDESLQKCCRLCVSAGSAPSVWLSCRFALAIKSGRARQQ